MDERPPWTDPDSRSRWETLADETEDAADPDGPPVPDTRHASDRIIDLLAELGDRFFDMLTRNSGRR